MEFIVNSELWKTFYRMKLRGNEVERMIKFAFIVDGTIMLKLKDLLEKLGIDTSVPEIKDLSDLKKLVNEKAKQVKDKDLKKLVKFYFARVGLDKLGFKNWLSKREVAEMIKKKI